MTDIDQLALDAAEKIIDIDPEELKGGRAQAQARIQCIIADAIRRSREGRDAEVRLEFAKEAARRHGGLNSIIEVAEAINHWRPIEERSRRIQ